MPKGRIPTSEELQFIYRFFAQGASDADVIAKYDELEMHGKLGFSRTGRTYVSYGNVGKSLKPQGECWKKILKEELTLY